MSIRHVYTACLYGMSIRHVYTACLHGMSIRHVYTACPYGMSTRHVSFVVTCPSVYMAMASFVVTYRLRVPT